MCRARLSWRSPPRLSRCRVVWPLEAGIGAAPASRAKAASERTRPRCDQATISCAATIGPTPGSSSSCGASARTWPRISAFELGRFQSGGPRSLCERAQHECRGELVRCARARAAQPAAAFDQPVLGQLAQPLGKWRAVAVVGRFTTTIWVRCGESAESSSGDCLGSASRPGCEAGAESLRVLVTVYYGGRIPDAVVAWFRAKFANRSVETSH